MPAVAPDIAILRNQIIQELRPRCTLQEIADELGMTRQSVWKLVDTYGLDGRPPTRRALSADELHILRVAEALKITPLVPITLGATRTRRAKSKRLRAARAA